MKIKYNDKASLDYLAEQLSDAPFNAKTGIILGCYMGRLMIPPFVLRFVQFFMNPVNFFARLLVILEANPDVTDIFWDQILDHLLNGKDKTTKDAAGGWNQQELGLFIKLLKENGFEFGEP